MKLTGKGGTVSLGGNLKGNVTRFDYSETTGQIKGNLGANISVTYILESVADVIRQNQTINFVGTVGNPATITITANDCHVRSVSIPVQRDSAVTQTIELECYTTPQFS